MNAQSASANLISKNAIVSVWKLSGEILLEGLKIDVVDALGEYTGTYNAVGSIELDENGLWVSTDSTHNAFRADDLTGRYIVYDRLSTRWKLIYSSFDHNNIGMPAVAASYQLAVDEASLPEPYGRITEVEVNVTEVPEHIWRKVHVGVTRTSEVVPRCIVHFGGNSLTGYIQQR